MKKLILNSNICKGADLVVLDEGHRIKNLKTATSKAVNQISTGRRIILTGTPMQNNLNECESSDVLREFHQYIKLFFRFMLADFSMVDFIKPEFLGSKADFAEEYANPIKKGQHKDSNPWEVKEMVEKSFILHRKLADFVQVNRVLRMNVICENNSKLISIFQRRDVAVLKEFLPKKFEYDIFITMTEIQVSRLFAISHNFTLRK